MPKDMKSCTPASVGVFILAICIEMFKNRLFYERNR